MIAYVRYLLDNSTYYIISHRIFTHHTVVVFGQLSSFRRHWLLCGEYK